MVVVVSISDQRNTEWLVCPSSLFMIIRYLDFWQIESFKTWLVSSTEELSPTSCKKYSKCWEILAHFLDQVACCIFQQKAMTAVRGLVLDKTQTTGSILPVTGSGCLRTAAVQCLSLFVITPKLLTNCGMFNTQSFNYMFETNAYQINKHF